MENHAKSASTESNRKLVESQSKFLPGQYSNSRHKHQDVAPPEPERTKLRFDRNCALFAEYPTLAVALPKAFDLFDRNRDGSLTKQELADSVPDKRVVDPNEAGLLAGLYENFDQLSGLSRTFWGGKKFDKDTVRAFLEIVKKSELSLHVIRSAWQWTDTSEAAELGLDFKRGCTKQSLSKASGTLHNSDAAKSAIGYLLNNFDLVSSDGVLTDESLGKYYLHHRISNDDFKLTFYFEDDFEMAKSLKADKRSQSLYWHKSEPLLDIRSENIVQGRAGDCTFKSALSCLANSRPQNIMSMIRQKSADTYSVTFPGFKPVDVEAPTLAEQVLYQPDVHSGFWLDLLEKAYGTIAGRTDEKKEFAGKPVEEKTALLWRGTDAIGLLTGHQTKHMFFGEVNENDAMKELRKAFSSPVKPIVTVGSAKPHDENLSPNHSYAVEKLIPASHSKGEMLVLKNSQGENKNASSAEITITPHHFWVNFADLYIEQIK